MSQYDLLQGVASAANDANSLVQVLGRGRDLLLLMEDWERAVAFLVEGDPVTRLYPVPNEREAEIADDEATPSAPPASWPGHPRSAQRRQAVGRRAGLVAFPIKHLGRVHAVGVMTARRPRWSASS